MTFDEYEALNEELGMFEADVFWAACLLKGNTADNLVFKKCRISKIYSDTVDVVLCFKDPYSNKTHNEWNSNIKKVDIEKMLLENKRYAE